VSTTLDVSAPVAPRLRVARACDVPAGVMRLFGAVAFRNPYAFRSRNGLARVPAAEGEGPWEYEGRVSAAGMSHAYRHPDGRVTSCKVRYMTRYECQETYRRVLTGELTQALAHHHLRITISAVVNLLKGRSLACTCPFPAPGQPDWCHGAVLAQIAATHELARLNCPNRAAAAVVARQADSPGTHRAVASGATVVLSYVDKRYPLDVADWAFKHGHADDAAAAAVIGAL
jgi:hypothetical protein